MIPPLEGWPTKAKEAPSPHGVRLAPLDTNPLFQNLGGKYFSVRYFSWSCLIIKIASVVPQLRQKLSYISLILTISIWVLENAVTWDKSNIKFKVYSKKIFKPIKFFKNFLNISIYPWNKPDCPRIFKKT